MQQDLDKALADIVAIRSQIARETAFRGLGAATVAGTGGLALACAVGQARDNDLVTQQLPAAA